MNCVMLAAGLASILSTPRLEPSVRSSNLWPTLFPCSSLNACSSLRNSLSALARSGKNSGSFEPHVRARWDATSAEAPPRIKTGGEEEEMTDYRARSVLLGGGRGRTGLPERAALRPILSAPGTIWTPMAKLE